MLAARRGLGAEEDRLASPRFLAAVRWATFAGEVAPELVRARDVAATDPDEGLLRKGGPGLTAFNARRTAARAVVAELEPILFPPDPEPADDD